MYSDLNQCSSFDEEDDGGGTSRKSLSFPKKYLLLKQTVRYCIIAACTSYCFYFLYVRVMEYLEFRTAVAVNVRFMKELYDILPGITLCSQSKFPLASLECFSAVNEIRSSAQTSSRDKYRQSNDIIEKEVSQILSDVKLGDLSHDSRLTESDQLIKDILCDRTTWRLSGKFASPSLPDTCNNVFKVRSIERDAGVCFTLFHRSALMAMKVLKGNFGRDKITKPDPETEQLMAFGSYTPPIFPENGLMTIKVNYNLLPASKPNQSTFLSEPYGGKFWVHSSRVIPKMSTVGYRFYPGKRYTVYLKKDIFHLMKPPYQTNCRNYTEEYEEAVLKSGRILDLGIPISQEACIDECIATQVVQHKSCGCWPPVLPFRHENNSQYRDMKWCNEEKEEFCYSEFVKNCSDSCLSDCLQEHYEVVIKENKHPDPGSLEMLWDALSPEQIDKTRKDINMFQPETQIDIVFSSNEETYHDHDKDLDAVQLAVNIAGLFGLFVSFSMDYTIDVYEHLRDFIRKRRRVSSLQ